MVVQSAKLCAVSRWGRVVGTVFVGIVAALAGSTGAGAEVDQGSDSDPGNQLWDCSARRVPFGDPGVDVLRCLTFTFDPPDDIENAVLYLDIDAPTNSLQDTDLLVVAVGQPFDECTWAQGAMAGCLVVHGGFAGGERSLVVDLVDLGCDVNAVAIDATRQQAMLDQLATGVVHVMLQDDTAVNGAWLDINGAPAPTCGTSVEAVPVAVVEARPATPSDSGTSNSVTILALAGVGAAAVAVSAGTAARRTRLRKVRRAVGVRRVPDAGRIEMSNDDHRSVAVSVRSFPDEIGSQILFEPSSTSPSSTSEVST